MSQRVFRTPFVTGDHSECTLTPFDAARTLPRVVVDACVVTPAARNLFTTNIGLHNHVTLVELDDWAWRELFVIFIFSLVAFLLDCHMFTSCFVLLCWWFVLDFVAVGH